MIVLKDMAMRLLQRRITSIDIIMSGLMNQCIVSRRSRIMNDQISARNLNTIVLPRVLI